MHYDENYFRWQKGMGEFGGHAELFKFREFVNTEDTVLDFGCGGGYLLNNVKCTRKAGIEINPTARELAQSMGITVHDSIAAVPDEFASLVISNHALEHVECPFQNLVDLKPKIKMNGRLVFVVPHEGPHDKWQPDDINQHLYTWNPMTLGNLFSKAGYGVCAVNTIRHRWPPRGYLKLYQFSSVLFHLFCKMEAYRIGNYQIQIVAERN